MRSLVTILFIPVFMYGYTLSELVDVAHQNRLVKSAKHSLNASEKTYESTQSSYLPSIDIGASVQNASEETMAMAQNTFRAHASLNYMLYDGGKKYDLYKRLNSNVDAKKKNLEAIKNDISLQMSRLYYQYLSLLSDKKVTLQETEQLKAELTRLNIFYTSGSVTKDEVQKIDSRVKSSNVTLQEIELNIQKTLHTLEYYTNKKINSVSEGSKITYKDIESKSIRPDIKRLKFEAESTLHAARSIKSQNYPTIYFDNTLTYNKYSFSNSSLESSFLVDTQNIASLNISWNIIDFGATSKSYEATYEEYLSQKDMLEHKKAIADVDYRLAKKSLHIAKIKIDATKATLEAASSTYELIKLRYQNGVVDNIAYLQALSEKYDASRKYKRALYDYEIKKAEVIYYSGKDIKEYLQ